MTAHELARLLLDMNTATAAKVRNHGDAVAFFAARRADLLRVAQENVDSADAARFIGDAEGDELVEWFLAAAREALAEVARIDACRVAA